MKLAGFTNDLPTVKEILKGITEDNITLSNDRTSMKIEAGEHTVGVLMRDAESIDESPEDFKLVRGNKPHTKGMLFIVPKQSGNRWDY